MVRRVGLNVTTLSPTAIQRFSLQKVKKLTAVDLKKLTSPQVQAFVEKQIDVLSRTQMKALTTNSTLFSDNQISMLKTRQIKSISLRGQGGMDILSKLTYKQMKLLSSAQMYDAAPTILQLLLNRPQDIPFTLSQLNSLTTLPETKEILKLALKTTPITKDILNTKYLQNVIKVLDQSEFSSLSESRQALVKTSDISAQLETPLQENTLLEKAAEDTAVVARTALDAKIVERAAGVAEVARNAAIRAVAKRKGEQLIEGEVPVRTTLQARAEQKEQANQNQMYSTMRAAQYLARAGVARQLAGAVAATKTETKMKSMSDIRQNLINKLHQVATASDAGNTEQAEIASKNVISLFMQLSAAQVINIYPEQFKKSITAAFVSGYRNAAVTAADDAEASADAAELAQTLLEAELAEKKAAAALEKVQEVLTSLKEITQVSENTIVNLQAAYTAAEVAATSAQEKLARALLAEKKVTEAKNILISAHNLKKKKLLLQAKVAIDDAMGSVLSLVNPGKADENDKPLVDLSK
jgi:hypothetical protein